MLTRWSVHWAERIVATSSSSGVWKVQRALGLRILAPQGADYLGGVSLGFIAGGHDGTPREENLDGSGRPAAKAHFRGRRRQFSSPPAPDVK